MPVPESHSPSSDRPAEAQIALEELPVGLYIDREAVEVVEPAHIDAARRIALRLVLQGGAEFGRRLVPLRLIVKLDQVLVRIAEPVSRAVAQFALVPADLVAGALQRLHAPLEGLRAAGAEGRVAEARCLRGGQLQGVALV